MTRRRKDSTIDILPALAGLFFLGIVFSPQFRALLFCSVVVLAGIALIVLICLWRIRAGKNRDKQIESCLSVTVPASHRQHYILQNLQPGSHRNENSAQWASSSYLPEPAAEIPTTENILQKIRSIDWFQFEKLVAAVYRKLGYAVTRRGGANPDGGIDLIIEKAGEKIAIQCKQWKTWNVGVKAVREFLGALTD